MSRKPCTLSVTVLLVIAVISGAFIIVRLGMIGVSEVLADLSFLIAVAGIILQIRDGHRHFDKMERIEGLITTKRAGPFPGHLTEIIALIRRANTQIRIVADCVDYGSFSAPELYDQLLGAVREAGQRGVATRVIVAGGPANLSRSNAFSKNTYGQLFADRQFQHALGRYLSFHKSVPPPQDADSLASMLATAHSVAVGQWCDAGASVRSVAQSSGLFFWLRDEEEAIFLMGHPGSPTCGLALQTRDSDFLAIFRDAFEVEWNARPNEDRSVLGR